MQTAANFEQERLELEAILASGILLRAPSLSQLLVYICTKYFEGEANQLKEYNIAVEAFGRPPDFDQKRDSIVRVEAHRLRKRLREYYESAGAGHAVQIEIPSGQYAPRFVAQERTPAVLTEAPAQAIETVERPRRVFSVPADPRPGKRVLAMGGLAALAIVGWAAVSAWRSAPGTAALASAHRGTAGALDAEELRILAGSNAPYVDRFGKTWGPDRYFSGGSVFDVPDHPIFGTRDPKIYRTRREGLFGYDIPLKKGVYELRLHFAETLYGDANIAGGGEASRIFAVEANGKRLLDGLDVIGEAGASTADVRAFKDISPQADGQLHLKFTPVNSNAFLNAIEITPGMPGKMAPIRLISRDHGYTGRDGVFWEADRYSHGGQLVMRPDPVQGVADPEIYRGERFGNITYSIPAPPGRYGLTMRFSETWFGPDKPGQGGQDSRVFDILCNGVALARNVDIFKEAGGSNRPLNKVFHNLAPNAQGKLVVSFAPIKNYACINALEVVDETP
jgi:hypothetical protein